MDHGRLFACRLELQTANTGGFISEASELSPNPEPERRSDRAAFNAVRGRIAEEISGQLRRVLFESRHKARGAEFEREALRSLFQAWKVIDTSIEASFSPEETFSIKELPETLSPDLRQHVVQYEELLRNRSKQALELAREHDAEELFYELTGKHPYGRIRQHVIFDTLIWDCEDVRDRDVAITPSADPGESDGSLPGGVYMGVIVLDGQDCRLIVLSADEQGVDVIRGPIARHEYRHYINHATWQIPNWTYEQIATDESRTSERRLQALAHDLLDDWTQSWKDEVCAYVETVSSADSYYLQLLITTDSELYNYPNMDSAYYLDTYRSVLGTDEGYESWHARLVQQYKQLSDTIVGRLGFLVGLSNDSRKELQQLHNDAREDRSASSDTVKNHHEKDVADARIAGGEIDGARTLVRFLSVFPMTMWPKLIHRITKDTTTLYELAERYDKYLWGEDNSDGAEQFFIAEQERLGFRAYDIQSLEYALGAIIDGLAAQSSDNMRLKIDELLGLEKELIALAEDQADLYERLPTLHSKSDFFLDEILDEIAKNTPARTISYISVPIQQHEELLAKEIQTLGLGGYSQVLDIEKQRLILTKREIDLNLSLDKLALDWPELASALAEY